MKFQKVTHKCKKNLNIKMLQNDQFMAKTAKKSIKGEKDIEAITLTFFNISIVLVILGHPNIDIQKCIYRYILL